MWLNRRSPLLIIIVFVVVALLAIGSLWYYQNRIRSQKLNQVSNKTGLPAPEFLNVAEKQKLGVSPDLKIQSLGRNASGTVTVYKIIKSDSDIIIDPAKIGPLVPPHKTPVK